MTAKGVTPSRFPVLAQEEVPLPCAPHFVSSTLRFSQTGIRYIQPSKTKTGAQESLTSTMAFVAYSLSTTGSAARTAWTCPSTQGLGIRLGRGSGGRARAKPVPSSLARWTASMQLSERVNYVVEVPIKSSVALSAGEMLLHERWLSNVPLDQERRATSVQLIADLTSNQLSVGAFGIVGAQIGTAKSDLVQTLVLGDPLYEQGRYAIAEASVRQWRPVVKEKLNVLLKGSGPVFCFTGIDRPGCRELRASTRPRHLAFLSSSGIPALGGPLLSDTDGGPVGSLVVIQSLTEQTAATLFAHDPYAQEGLFAYTLIRGLARVRGAF
ncbi:hypothetical protein FVE85_5385 [Porphyridium purpureum]|uniref:YCII-related domain-containing protein n=1 Tax=Porphyridium purpureum TaxID=35688 RepID=A0A5J4Z3D3_PORPP|nr:hypothetical protein FVE85_5385 [Porphyridium purpureum]|eukprot:POR4421..scf295_1